MNVCARMSYIEIDIAQSHTYLYIVLFLSTNPSMKLAYNNYIHANMAYVTTSR